jgi:acyl-ACP thioesterase
VSLNVEFVPPHEGGRRFNEDFRVRLADTNADGTLRLDAAARFLQDIATDDWDDTGIGDEDTWVVRRTALRVVEKGSWPRYKDHLTLETWCGGYGAAWAERRTNFYFEGELQLEAISLWVPIDSRGVPQRLRQSFFDVYGEALNGRKIPGRVPTPELIPAATRQPWPLRHADLDIVGHVNNAAIWQAITEVVEGPVREVAVMHHGPVEAGHIVELAHVPGHVWLIVDGEPRVSCLYFA